MDGYKHYIRIDANNIVIHRFSDAFETPLETDILIAENAGRHYNEPWTNADGFYLYKWDGTQQVERTQDEIYPLSYWKEKKIADFVTLRDAEIIAGFLTNAVASTPGIEMGYNAIDKVNYQGLATMLNLDPTMASVQFMTGNHGMFTFTRDEFIQVIKDAYDHESALVYKKLSLEAQVNAATTQAELDAVVW